MGWVEWLTLCVGCFVGGFDDTWFVNFVAGVVTYCFACLVLRWWVLCGFFVFAC